MIKQKKLPSTQSIVLNGAGAVVVLATVVAALRATLLAPGLAPCSERYDQAVRMSLDHNGRAMHINELQAISRGTDWNLLSHARIVNLREGPAKQALEVKTLVQRDESQPDAKAGVGFTWSPATLPRAVASVCLGYQVFVPEGFDFGAGGRLPGLVANRESDPVGKDAAFTTRFHFDERGKIDVVADLPGRNSGRALGGGGHDGRLTPGAWTDVQQEVVLNTPGAADGIVRVWVDGAIKFEKPGLLLRKSAEETVAGVVAEVLVRPRPRSEPKQSAIWMSPFEVRWGPSAR